MSEAVDISSQTIPMAKLAPLLEFQLSQGGTATLTVTGSSMLPLLRHHRDSVQLQPPPPCLRKGDIILFCRDNGQFVLHRIIKVQDQDGPQSIYICCGDNQWRQEQVRHEQVKALAGSFSRDGRPCSPDSPGYGLYRWLTLALFPIRRPLISIRRRLGRIKRWLKKRKNSGRTDHEK